MMCFRRTKEEKKLVRLARLYPTASCIGLIKRSGVAQDRGYRMLRELGFKIKTPERPLEERLKNYIVDAKGCWLWQGTRNTRDGYGYLFHGGKSLRVHRVSWSLANNNAAIPKGMYICHKCDVPQCMNPEHLYLGTPQENAIDMVKKGRHGLVQTGRAAKGERCGGAKAKKEQIEAIRLLFGEHTYSVACLARIFPVLSESAIRNIVKGKTWVEAA